MGIKLRNNEHPDAFLWRVGNMVNSSLLTWQQAAELLNSELGLRASKETYQRKYNGARSFYVNVFQKEPQTVDQKELLAKLKKERIKLQTAQNENRRNLRKEAREELLFEQIKEAVKAFKPPKVKYTPHSPTPREYVLTIADIHAGAEIDSENNTYNNDICKERFESLLSQTIDYIKSHKIAKLNILELGDSVQGILRMSDLVINQRPVIEEAVFVSELIATFLQELSAYAKIEYYHCPTSNHSQIRPLASKASELGGEDLEYIISHLIKAKLEHNDRVRIHLNHGHEYIELKIAGHDCIAYHGHNIKGLKTALQRIQQIRHKFYSSLFLAHYHHAESMVVGESMDGNCEVLVVPAFVGSDPYADRLLVGAKASSAIYGYETSKGHVSTETFILN